MFYYALRMYVNVFDQYILVSAELRDHFCSWNSLDTAAAGYLPASGGRGRGSSVVVGPDTSGLDRIIKRELSDSPVAPVAAAEFASAAKRARLSRAASQEVLDQLVMHQQQLRRSPPQTAGGGTADRNSGNFYGTNRNRHRNGSQRWNNSGQSIFSHLFQNFFSRRFCWFALCSLLYLSTPR